MMKPQSQIPHKRMDEMQTEDLIRQYLPLVRKTISRMSKEMKQSADSIELFENGVLALVEALKSYRYEDAMPFPEYAERFVCETIIETLRKNQYPENPVEVLPFDQLETESEETEETERSESVPSGKVHDVLMLEGDPLTSLLNDENTRLVAIALNRLPHAERAVLQMSFYDNLSPSQMAMRLGISVEEISALRNSGLRRLRKRLLMHN